MQSFGVIVLLVLVSSARSRSIPDEASVVSVYTTLPTTSGTSGLDVYQQIANNLAERISTPIYRFFGLGNTTTQQNTTHRSPENHTKTNPWKFLELTEDPQSGFLEDNSGEITTTTTKHVLNSKANQNKRKSNKLVNSLGDDYEDDVDINKVDDPCERQNQPKMGPIVYALEWFGQMFQLIWGAIAAVITPFNKQ